MMDNECLSKTKIPGLVYSCFDTEQVVEEQFIGDYGMCYIVSGSLKVRGQLESSTFQQADLLFYRKNFLAKFTKQPDAAASFKAITVVFDSQLLQGLSKQYEAPAKLVNFTEQPVLKLDKNLLLENFYSTLVPYFDAALPESLVTLKKQEAVMLLLQVNPQLKDILFDFSQPGKINLEAFMQQNFRFNVELKKMAFLTGRSLATFKRDFEKIFHTSPNRWLQQRRLEEAHYLIKEKSKRPSEVYHEVGFESIAHFSYSFKQFFGVNPSRIQ